MNRFPTTAALLFSLAALAVAIPAGADDAVTWQLLPQVKVDSTGIFLSQIVVPIPATPAANSTAADSSSVATSSSVVLPHIRLAPAPSPGQTVPLSRAQIIDLVHKYQPDLDLSNWTGAVQVRVSRRTRQLAETEMSEMLKATLQKDFIKARGELELHLARAFDPVTVPDEPLTLKVADLPASGMSPNCIVRCELWNGPERVGGWQLVVQASVWREIPVAGAPLSHGTLLRDAEIVMERRDILLQRDAFLNYPSDDATLELAESIPAGQPVLNRSIHVRPLIRRGRLIEGLYQDGSLSISLKVEAMEDGMPGQLMRVRNPKTKRELYGKVQNEQTVLIAL